MSEDKELDVLEMDMNENDMDEAEDAPPFINEDGMPYYAVRCERKYECFVALGAGSRKQALELLKNEDVLVDIWETAGTSNFWKGGITSVAVEEVFGKRET